MQDEVQTDVLLQEAFKANKNCFIPRYYTPGNTMDMVLLKDMNDYHNLPLTKWKIKQPAIDEVRQEALDFDKLNTVSLVEFTRGPDLFTTSTNLLQNTISKCCKSC